MKKEYLLFDLDGTLTDSMPGITRAVQYTLQRYGIIEEDLNVLKPFVGPPLHESFMEYYNFTPEDAKQAIYVYREYYNVKGWAENVPYEGIAGMLERLKQDGRRLFVATSKPEEIAKRVLDHFDLLRYFEFVGGASEDSSRVNKDDVIRYVMKHCGMEDPASVLMVGDRRHDIAGAHKAGVEAIGVLYGYGSREELLSAAADWIVEDVAALEEQVRKLMA